MPYRRNGRVNPDDLAKRVARHLADTGPRRIRSSLRDSVLMARAISGVIALVAMGLLVLAVVVGANWLLDRPTPEQATEAVFDPDSFFGSAESTSTTALVADEVAAIGLTSTTVAAPLVPTQPRKPGLLPALPSPTTTPVSTTVPVTTSSSTATTPTIPTSTSSTSTTSTLPTTTTTTTTTTSSSTTSTTTTSTTTTSTTTTSTTTTSTTTTTIPTTTTTSATTTST